MRLLAVLLAAVGLLDCHKVPSHNRPVSIAEATKLSETAEANFTKGDVNAVMAQYAENAVLIDANSPNPTADRRVQTKWAQMFVSMQPADYKVIDRHIQLLGADAFVSSGVETFTVAAGRARPTVSARFNDVFQRQKDGSWRIVNEHVSMPPAPSTSAAQ